MRIAPDGNVTFVRYHNPACELCLGRITLARLASEEKLLEVRPGFYRSTDYQIPITGSPGDPGFGTLQAGWREAGRRGEDLYALLYVPSLLLAFVIGSLCGSFLRPLARVEK